MDRLRRALSRSEGLTLVELLVVVVILGILLAIALPSYLGFRDRANRSDSQANLREAVPSAQAYYADCGTYLDAGPCLDGKYHAFQILGSGAADGSSGADAFGLAAFNAGISSDDVSVNTSTATGYCLQSSHQGSTTYYYAGPDGSITDTKPAGCV